jgi:hypothetical protein
MKQYGGGSRIRLAVVNLATAAIMIALVTSKLGTWISAAPVSDWRKWAPLAGLIAFILGASLWEVNGPTLTAVNRYLGDGHTGKPGT